MEIIIDLHNINAAVVTMGSLQPGLPALSCTPTKWPLVFLDL